MLLSNDELMAIRMKAKWKDELNDYKIPPFILRNKRVEFPKLNHKQGTIFLNNFLMTFRNAISRKGKEKSGA